MFATLLLLCSFVTAPRVSLIQGEDARRQFDFWVGEWSVQNRHLQDDGSWRDGTVTRARITPVCDGAAILEEWAGPFGNSFMNGFSLRAWDPGLEAWSLLLFWTMDGNSTFGQLSGTFRHGRGEFLAPSTGPQRTRYTFSDALPDSVRWDSSRTEDAGQTWRTDWIMEFSRTRDAAETTQERLFEVPWTEGELSPHPQARQLDWMLGEWQGVQTLAGGEEREARLSCKLLDKDCLVLDLLRTRKDASSPWAQRLAVRGYESLNGHWLGWHLSDEDTRLARAVGSLRDGNMVFERADGDARIVEYLVALDDDQAQIEVARVTPDGAASVLSSTLLERADD